jgi:hypothetical protein
VALVVVAVLGSVAAPQVWWVFVIGLVPLGLFVFAFWRIEVIVDDTALAVRYGLAGWPVQRITLDRVRRAQAIDLQPIDWGGWGYRGSLKLRKKAAVVVRKGPALRLELDEDLVELAITVDDAPGAVAAITAILS